MQVLTAQWKEISSISNSKYIYFCNIYLTVWFRKKQTYLQYKMFPKSKNI